MPSRQAAAVLAARGARNPEQLAAWLASRLQPRGVELSARYPVASADDILVTRSPSGGAAVRHRRGGALIGEIRFDNGWTANYGGKDLRPHSHQRGALAELLGIWNRGTSDLRREGAEPLQPPPVQTELMAQYGVPAIRALAIPVTSSGSGPRVTMANGSGPDDNDDDDKNGGNGSSKLGPRGQSVYKKLKAKGWDDAKAMKFAAMAEKNQGRIGGS